MSKGSVLYAMGFIDSAILDVTEWFCRRLQVLTGRTNVWLAVQLTNLSIVVYFVWAVANFWSSDWGSRMLLALFCGGLLYVLTQTIFREPIEAYETSAYQRVARGLRNPRRIRDAPLRISFLTLSILLFYPTLLAYVHLKVRTLMLTYSLIVLTTALLYVLACDMLPPCAGIVKEWLQGLVRARVKVQSTSRANYGYHPERHEVEASKMRRVRVRRVPPGGDVGMRLARHGGEDGSTAHRSTTVSCESTSGSAESGGRRS